MDFMFLCAIRVFPTDCTWFTVTILPHGMLPPLNFHLPSGTALLFGMVRMTILVSAGSPVPNYSSTEVSHPNALAKICASQVRDNGCGIRDLLIVPCYASLLVWGSYFGLKCFKNETLFEPVLYRL